MLPDDDAPGGLLILIKPGLAGLSQDWHPHLANSAGRPRCGALLNLREWQLRNVGAPPRGLCARCARLLGPRFSTSHSPARRHAAPPDAAQMGLPLDDDDLPEDTTSDE